VKGKPRLALQAGGFADYTRGSGTDTLIFTAPAPGATATKFDFAQGTILATEASSHLRSAREALPR
jgi:hypothetical protein